MREVVKFTGQMCSSNSTVNTHEVSIITASPNIISKGKLWSGWLDGFVFKMDNYGDFSLQIMQSQDTS